MNVEAANSFMRVTNTEICGGSPPDVRNINRATLRSRNQKTMAADGKWLAVGCKFLDVIAGRLAASGNEQLIDISVKNEAGGRSPGTPASRTIIIFKRDLISTRQIYKMDEFPLA